jgi:uncharacterized MnhB-related membrane protein
MNNRPFKVMEIVWLFVLIMAVAATFLALYRREVSDTIIFAVISLTSAGMYYMRRNQRKNNQG